MALTLKVALDTNMLTAAQQFKIDAFSEVSRILGKTEFIIPTQVMEELEKIKDKGKTVERAVKIAEQLLKKNKFKKVKVKAKNADDALIKLAEKNVIIATNDKKLREKIKKAGGKCLLLRKKKLMILG